MYSFRERPDTRVLDEPLYGHYLTVTDADHPGAHEVMEAMDNDGERVVREVILGRCEKPVLFLKNMAHHLAGLDRAFLREITNVLLTRDPREMLPSLLHQLPSPTLRDTGLREQVEILEAALASGNPPVVLDARELLLDPRGVLGRACERLGIPFDEAMLRWPAGPKPEDGIWARHWYRNVHASTGFGRYSPKPEPFPERLEPLLRECLPLYEELRRHAITAGA
ncbi:sulfotransferase family protein [Rubrobacter marinus]|uniref:Sulfotransferase family protein n=2 Tax=Rubrobacter marinus TaxID=2653852 RepID=A0A6G8Q2X8_9ACTN|nr:sulfotransferase family protein [Rubrobacter marinus]